MSQTIFSYQYNPAFPPDWEGLCFESARDATPRWYGVSFGNGNDGVSHMYPAYYVKTFDPWTLAAAALIGDMASDYHDWASENMDVDGEADYGISAMILNPPDDNSDWRPDHSECGDGEDCEGCPECENQEPDGSWSDANGAWRICEIFPVSDDELPDRNSDPWCRPMYASLENCFGATAPELALAREA